MKKLLLIVSLILFSISSLAMVTRGKRYVERRGGKRPTTRRTSQRPTLKQRVEKEVRKEQKTPDKQKKSTRILKQTKKEPTQKYQKKRDSQKLEPRTRDTKHQKFTLRERQAERSKLTSEKWKQRMQESRERAKEKKQALYDQREKEVLKQLGRHELSEEQKQQLSKRVDEEWKKILIEKQPIWIAKRDIEKKLWELRLAIATKFGQAGSAVQTRFGKMKSWLTKKTTKVSEQAGSWFTKKQPELTDKEKFDAFTGKHKINSKEKLVNHFRKYLENYNLPQRDRFSDIGLPAMFAYKNKTALNILENIESDTLAKHNFKLFMNINLFKFSNYIEINTEKAIEMFSSIENNAITAIEAMETITAIEAAKTYFEENETSTNFEYEINWRFYEKFTKQAKKEYEKLLEGAKKGSEKQAEIDAQWKAFEQIFLINPRRALKKLKKKIKKEKELKEKYGIKLN